MWQVHTDRAGCFPRAGGRRRRRRRRGPKGGEEPAFNPASTCDVGGEQLYQQSRGIYTGHFMQIQPSYLQSSQTLFTTAGLPKLDQEANHNNLLKRPEALRQPPAAWEEAAQGVSKGGRGPAWVRGGTAGHPTPRAARQELILFHPLSGWPPPLGIALPVQRPQRRRSLFSLQMFMCTVPGKDSDWLGWSHVPVLGTITVAVAGSHGHRIM